MSEILPTYIGNCEIEETERSDMRVDTYGLDAFTQNYQGWKKKDKVAQFLAKLKANKTNSQIADPKWNFVPTGYPGFSVKTFQFSTDRSFATFSVEFVGKVDNSEPEVSSTDSWTENTLQLYVGETLCEIDYRAPKTLYRYATKTRPTGPRYRGIVASGDLGIEIIAKRGWTAEGFSSLQELQTQTAFFMTQFERTQAGQWWEVIEEHEMRLVQQMNIQAIAIQ